MKRFLAVAALAFSLITAAAANLSAQPSSNQAPATAQSTKSTEVDALLAPFNQGNTPGASVLVIQNGQIVHHKGYGLARLDTKEPIGPTTACDLASTAKPFTAMAVMILAERGKLSYDDPLSKYFPKFPAYAQKVTIKNLLTHTSGLVDVVNASWFKPGYQPTSKEVAAFVTKQPNPKSAPGEKFEYNNAGYLLLALIVEKASGQSFSKFMRENIFKPLGMNRTVVWDEKKPKVEHFAISYAPAGGAFGPIDPVSDTFIFGAKGVITTSEDLVKWIEAWDTPKLIKPETLRLALTPMKLNDGSETSYGFGWGLGKENGLATIEHPGGYLGYRANIKRYPSERTSIVVLSNNAQADVQMLASRIGRIYVGDKMVMPQAKLKVHAAVLNSYVGKYQTDPAAMMGVVLEITLENDELYVTSPIRPKAKLIAQSAEEFTIGESTAAIRFKKDEKGAVTGLILKARMGTIEARRLPN
jgi:CubicO group peptidase (beta-lactamase class C family)